MPSLATILFVATAFSAAVMAAAPTYDATAALSALYYAKASYCPLADIQTWKCEACAFHSTFVLQASIFNTAYDMQAYVGFDPTTSTAVVAFRGSHDIKNWIANLKFDHIPYPDATCPGGCEVHKGFLEAYRTIQSGIRNATETVLLRHPGASILVTGHSLGAALSTLATLDLLRTFPSQITSLKNYNFGQPRVGNAAFAAWAAGLVEAGGDFRVTHDQDPVPHLPPESFGFLHVPHEIYYTNDTEFKICNDGPTGEDGSCSDANVPDNILDHGQYLGISVCCGTVVELC